MFSLFAIFSFIGISSNTFAENDPLIDAYEEARKNIRIDTDLAIAGFISVANEAEKYKRYDIAAKSLSTLSKVKAMLGHTDAFSIANEGLRLAIISNDKVQHVAALEAFGVVAFYLDDNEQALKYYTDAQRIYKENALQNKRLWSLINNNIVNIYDALGQYELALSTLLQTLNFRVENDLPKISVLYNISHFYNRLGNIKESLKYAEELKKEAALTDHGPSKLDYHFLTGEALYNDWQINTSIQSLIQAETHLRSALNYTKDNPKVENFHYCDKLLALSRVLIARGLGGEAEGYLEEALELAAKLKQSKQTIEAHELLVEIYKTGDFEKAFTHMQVLSDIKQTQYNENLDKRVSAMLIQFDTAKKESDIQQAALKNESLQKSIQLSRYINYMVTGTAVFLTVSLLLLWRLYREKKKAAEKFEYLSNIDPLTRLMNRRAILERLAEQRAIFLRQNTPFNIVLADIDHFKKINDEYGHDAGDMVLKQVSTLLRESLRVQDIVGRWGGEEFLICLPSVTVEQAHLVIDKLRETISDCKLNWENRKISATMSFGVCPFMGNREIDSCISHADSALYTAKEKGRNRVVAVDKKDFSEAI